MVDEASIGDTPQDMYDEVFARCIEELLVGDDLPFPENFDPGSFRNIFTPEVRRDLWMIPDDILVRGYASFIILHSLHAQLEEIPAGEVVLSTEEEVLMANLAVAFTRSQNEVGNAFIHDDMVIPMVYRNQQGRNGHNGFHHVIENLNYKFNGYGISIEFVEGIGYRLVITELLD